MGLLEPEKKAKFNASGWRRSLNAQAQAYFETQLEELGLSRKQIDVQSLEELQQSLEAIDGALRHPESFGKLAFRISATGSLVLVSSNSDAHIELGILPILLERKKLILERIRILSASEKIGTIQDLIDKVADGEIKRKLEQEVASLKDEAQRLREQTKEVEQEQNQEQIKTQTELARLKVELFERRSKVWFSLLERESAATILGGILLFIILVAHVTAIFTRFAIPDILNNAFLIILGYFFGQSTNSESKRSSSASGSSDDGSA